MPKAYTFGAATFAKSVSLKSDALFKNPKFLEVEMATPGSFGVEVCKSDGTVIGQAKRPNANGGWATFHFQEGGEFGSGIPNGEYKIRLTNQAPGNRQVKAGRLEYDE